MGQEQYYLIYDDSVSPDIASPATIIRFHGYIYGDQIDELLREYQKGKHPIFWEQTEIGKNPPFIHRQINSDSVWGFTKWLKEKHNLPCEYEDYVRCQVEIPNTKHRQ